MSDDGIRDWDLLDQYARNGVQDAFAQIVKRYVDLVYATCFRDLRDRHMAEDATQAVFLVLARKARSLGREVILAGWLFQTARLVVRNARKQEARRKARERSAAEMIQRNSSTAMAWGGLSPLLSEGLQRLGLKDRNAILLHYFQRMTFAEVGSSTGVSEDAARMRVSRAVEKLRAFFGNKGQTLAVGAVATLLMASSVQAAPAGCTASVVTAVCGSTGHAALASGSAVALAKATMKTLVAAKLKTAAVVTAAALLVPAAGLATYRAVAAQPVQDRRVAIVKDVSLEGVAAPAPAATSPAGAPAAAHPSSPPVSAPKAKPRPAPRPVPPPTIARPEPPLTDRLRFRVENGLLTVAAPASPAGGKAARVELRGIPGETMISRKSGGLEIENRHAGSGGEIRTRIVYRPGAGMEIRRSRKPREGNENVVILQQGRTSDTASRPLRQVTVQVSADGGNTWSAWTADDYPRFVEGYPLAFFAHVAPVFREFAARNLLPLPVETARKALVEPRGRGGRAEPGNPVGGDDNSLPGAPWRREVELLERDRAFLMQCLESDDLNVRTAALSRLREATGKSLAFDAAAPAEKRRAMLNALRQAAGETTSGL